MLDSVALVHMNGRVYDPYLGRFLSPDTVVQSLAATQSINPYSYAWNDPLKYTDPDGHSLGSFLKGLITAVVTFVVYAVLDYFFGPVVAAFGAGFAGGFTGALLATGSLSAALSAGLMSGVTVGLLGPIGGGIANVIVGCVGGARSSGNCGRLAEAEAVDIGLQFVAVPGGGGTTGVWGTALSTVEAGVVGGIEAKLSGGSFNSGFSNAAGSYLGTNIAGEIVHAPTSADSPQGDGNNAPPVGFGSHGTFGPVDLSGTFSCGSFQCSYQMGQYSSGDLSGAWIRVSLSEDFGDGGWVQTWSDSLGGSALDCRASCPFYPSYASGGLYFDDDPARFVGQSVTWVGQTSYVRPYQDGAAFTFQWGFTLSNGSVSYIAPALTAPSPSQQQVISGAQWWLKP